MATNTMDAIKKKMQAMKGEKDNALEKADQLEQRVSEQKAINEKVAVDHRTTVLFCSEGWPHHGRTFSIYMCPLSFSLTLLRIVLSTS